jgi:uncharacterized protein
LTKVSINIIISRLCALQCRVAVGVRMALIDSLTFSREGRSVEGALPLAEFERLQDRLFGAPAAEESLSYQVSGGADAQARPVLRLKIAGRLLLQCQRCLNALDHSLAIDTVLRLVPEASLDAEIGDDPDEPECIAASAALDVIALIEDEILLALPAYPRHESGPCGGTDSRAGTQRNSAFSVLGELSTLTHKSSK